jgi:hypothetical protein
LGQSVAYEWRVVWRRKDGGRTWTFEVADEDEAREEAGYLADSGAKVHIERREIGEWEAVDV